MIIPTGDWQLALQLTKSARTNFVPAADKALKRVAVRAQAEIRRNIAAGPPPPLSPLTRAGGRKGGKPLNNNGDMKNAVNIVPAGALEYFIGIPQSAGEHNRAVIHEEGRIIVQKMTPAMQRMLHARLRDAGPPPNHSGAAIIVSQIPARPFVAPAFDKVRLTFQVDFTREFARALNGQYGRL